MLVYVIRHGESESNLTRRWTGWQDVLLTDKGRKDALWYFNIEFAGENGEVLFLPGQILVNSDEVYRKTVGGKLPFVEILEKIKLKTTAETV